MHVYGTDATTVTTVLGVSDRSLSRWYQLSKTTGNVLEAQPDDRSSRWSPAGCQYVREYVNMHLCFYFEELRSELKARFKDATNLSDSTICRTLRFDLGLTRKVLTKRARESVPRERLEYKARLQPFYSDPDQLLFIDETSKHGRPVLRRFGWSTRNTPATVSVPFSRGKRVFVVAAMDVQGFFAWGDVDDTFARVSFHKVFKEKILPFLNPWPLPRSIVVMDNAKIHMYEELQDLIHATGTLLFFLPPYSPDWNPIEVGFSLLKRWIQRHANMAFREDPLAVLMAAMYQCTRQKELVGEHLYNHCGYQANELTIK